MRESCHSKGLGSILLLPQVYNQLGLFWTHVGSGRRSLCTERCWEAAENGSSSPKAPFLGRDLPLSNIGWQKRLVPNCTNLNPSEPLQDTNLHPLRGWEMIYTYILWWISLFGLWPHHRGFSNLFWVLIDYSIWKNVQQIAPLIKVNQADVIDAKYMFLQ